jgi:yersiniabactin nonribosomal peptide synthetase
MMSITDLLTLCAQSGVRLELDADGASLRVRAPKGAMTEALRAQIAQQKAELIELLRRREQPDPKAAITPDPARRYEPFPLTDIQQAYVIGRQSSYGLGGPCAVYTEFSSRSIDVGRLERAWQRMIERHEVLRTVVRADLEQQVRSPEELAPYRIEVADLRALPEVEREARLAATRAQLIETARPLGGEPLFDLRATLLPDETRLHFVLDLLVADAASIGMLFADWERFYEDPERAAPPLALSFRDYVLAEHAARSGPAWQRAAAYWESRAATLPSGPDLPLCREPSSLPVARIRRLVDYLSQEEWQRFQAGSAAAGLTPSMALCAAWAEVLSRFSRSDRFLLNLTMFQRLPVHPEVGALIGDFTSTLLLERDGVGATFRERAQRLSAQFARDLDNAQVSGLQVQRLRMRASPGAPPAPAPLVFTSLVGQRRGDAQDPFGWGFLGEVCYIASRTPQVWIDHQVYESRGRLQVSWDVAEELFPAGLIDDLFGAFFGLLRHLSASTRSFQSEPAVGLPAAQAAERAAYNATSGPLPEEPLFAGFLRHAARHPEDPAILTAEAELSYAELERRSRALAGELVARGAGAERLVAILMPKGWEQVVAALAVVRAGAAYLPVDPDLPAERIALLLKRGEVKLALTTPATDAALEWPDAVTRLRVDAAPPAAPSLPAEPSLPEVAPSQLAYVIYTSGSTGEPKGVMIEHRAAVNTIADINERFGVRRGDRVLALSSLSFDLSVYDVFGVLAAGGAIVLPGADSLRDPTAWAPLMRRAGVTVWNSVPALLEMLVDYASGRAGIIPDALRVVMLSGDWIPVTLPDRLRALVPSAQVFSLGGATEASIWSIYYPIEQVPPDWTSIPYGRPLRNQRFYVLDAELRDRPVWVAGELYIGGDGLSRGYFGDAERTNERFIVHPRTGERLYRTGDLGRFLPGGDIEFLGRVDTQIKLRGFRVELGEIEAALGQHPAVSACAVVPEGPPRAPSQLVAYVVPRAGDASGDAPERPLSELCAAVQRELSREPLTLGQSEQATAIISSLISRLVISYTASALLQIGAFGRAGAPWTEGDLMGLGVVPRLRKWLRRALDLLTGAGMLALREGAWVAPAPLEPEPVEGLWQELLATPHDLGAEIGFLRRSGENMAAIVTGAVQAVEVLFPGGADADAQSLYQSNAFVESNRACRAIVAALAEGGEPIHALEIGAGVGSTTQHLLPVLPADRTSYVYTDISRYFLNLGKEQFSAFPYLRYQILDAERDPREQGLEAGSFNLVIGSSVLHATRDIRETLEHVRAVMRGGGVLLLIEETRFLPLHNLTMGLQQGFDRAADEALRPRHPLLTLSQWEELLTEAGFTEVTSVAPRDPWAVELGVIVILARLPRAATLGAIDETNVLAHLAARLPSYMVPSAVLPLQALPLSSNGKVDRAALSRRRAAARPAAGRARERVAPSTALEQELCACFSEVLGVAEVGAQDSFFALGGDSLLAAKLCARIGEQRGVDLPVRALFAHPTVTELGAHLESSSAAPLTAPLPELARHPEARWEPFPLTEVQQAYWLGRDAAFDLGNVATHAYFEFERPESDLSRVEAAWQALIERHDMLRATVRSDGTQAAAPETPPYRIEAADLRALPPAEVEASILRTREEMAHQVLDPQKWPLFCIRASLLPGGALRLHLSFDMLIVDASSLLLLIQEWTALLAGGALPPLELTFRDYVLAERELASHPVYRDARDYWLRRLHSLPAAPDLPLCCKPQEVVKPRFVRRSYRLVPARWQLLRQRALAAELTPSAVLLSAYAETLARFSRSARFTLNLTLFQRLPLHPQVDRIVGDFTSVLLLEVEVARRRPFHERAKALQQSLAEALDHRHYGGISLLRELSRLAEDRTRAAAPVVFTSALPLQSRSGSAKQQDGAAGSSVELLGKLVYSLAQTSQVWLDLQVLENEGALWLTWDAVEELFAPELLDEMFAAYVEAVRALADSDAGWLDAPGDGSARGAASTAPLLAAGSSRSRAQVPYVAPRTPTESSLAALWEKVLGGGPYGAEDDFLIAGGDSLLGARLLSTIERDFGITVSMTELYEERSLGALSLLIEERVLEQALAAQADGGAGAASTDGE